MWHRIRLERRTKLGTCLDWNYSQGTVCLSMNKCTMDIFHRFDQLLPRKPQHYPHPHNQPILSDKKQRAPDPDT